MREFMADKDGVLTEIESAYRTYEFAPGTTAPKVMFDPQTAFDPEVMKNIWRPLTPKPQPISEIFKVRVQVSEAPHKMGSHVSYTGTSDFNIIIDKAQASAEGFDMLATLTHELGHVVAAAAKLPANTSVMFIHNLNRSPKDTLAAEIEAWGVAQKLFDETKKKCLAEYAALVEPDINLSQYSFGGPGVDVL